MNGFWLMYFILLFWSVVYFIYRLIKTIEIHLNIKRKYDKAVIGYEKDINNENEVELLKQYNALIKVRNDSLFTVVLIICATYEMFDCLVYYL